MSSHSLLHQHLSFVEELKNIIKTSEVITPSTIKNKMNTSSSNQPPSNAPPPPPLPPMSYYPITAARLSPQPSQLKFKAIAIPITDEYKPSTSTSWRNINDNVIQMNFSFTKASLSDHIIGLNLMLGPVVGGTRDDPTLYPFLYLSSVGEANLLGRPNKDMNAVIISILNLTAPNVSGKALNTEAARARFVGETKALISGEGISNKYFNIEQKSWDSLVTSDNGIPFYENLQNDILSANISPQTAANIMMYLVQHSTDLVKRSGKMIYIQTFVSFAKRGAITDDKCLRLNDQFVQELGFDPKLKPELSNAIYDNLKTSIDETNAGAIFTTWSNDMADFSLRSKIILNQTIGSGLTSLYVIKEALSLAPNFNWAQVAKILPADINNVKQAFSIIGNNPYFGFASDLGVVKSTNYKSLAYLCKEICKKIGGPAFASLDLYGGWTRNPLHKHILVQMVRNFNPVEIDDNGVLIGFTQEDVDESTKIIQELADQIKVSFI